MSKSSKSHMLLLTPSLPAGDNEIPRASLIPAVSQPNGVVGILADNHLVPTLDPMTERILKRLHIQPLLLHLLESMQGQPELAGAGPHVAKQLPQCLNHQLLNELSYSVSGLHSAPQASEPLW